MAPIVAACRGRSVVVALALAAAVPVAAEAPAPATRTAPRATATTAQPYAPIKQPDDDVQVAEIEMFVGESRVFPAPGVARIAVGNGALLSASALDRREVILFANAAGTSSLFLWNEDGRHQRVKISIVPGDTTRHAREVAAFLSTIPRAHASLVGTQIIVEGDELTDTDLAKIEELAKRYPQIVNFTNRLGWEQMVMLDVKVVEFPVSVLREIGLAWSATGGAAIAGIWAPARRGDSGPYEVAIRTGPDNGVPITGPGGAPATIPSSLNAVAFMNLGLNAQLNLLAQEGKASLLAQPQLSARSGSKASFLAGGELPYTVSTRDGLAIQFKPYGVRLDITPRVDRHGVIRATIQTEVSGIDRSVSASGGPALLSRRTETEFNLRAGETLVLAGLLQREVSHDVNKVPLLGDLPLVGALFRSQRDLHKETELVVFVTPTVVDTASEATTQRIRHTQQRLRELQGGVDPDHLAPATNTRSGPADVAASAANPDVAARDRDPGGSWLQVIEATAVRTEPDVRSAVLLPLEAGAHVRLGSADAQAAGDGADWRNVVVGAVKGWVPSGTVRPRGMRTAMRDRHMNVAAPAALVVPVRTPASARRYRVERDGLALRASPDTQGAVLVRLNRGESVVALDARPRGAWTSVRVGEGDGARRGWVATQWLAPLSDAPTTEVAR